MNFKFFFKKLPRGYLVLEKIDSEINGQIEVREDIFGRRGIFVNKLSQSGYSVEKLWQKPLRRIKSQELGVKSCLILGLGAGSVTGVIHNFFPKAKIIGIEIDPMIIKLGKKYLDLSTVKNLKIEIKDAISCFNDLNHDSRDFNLILVDLYLGDKVPAGAETDKFIKSVKKRLAPKGVVIFNRLYYGKKKKEVGQFESRLKKIFSQVEPIHVSTNIFFLCQ